jgi:hypothetical protein
MSWNNERNIVKKDGVCWNRGKHKYCSYWKAKVTRDETKAVQGYRCSLFNLDKEGYPSLPICNKRFGKTYDGREDGTVAF